MRGQIRYSSYQSVDFAEALGVIFHLVVAKITSVDEEVGRRSKNFGPILGLAVWNFKLTHACVHNLFGTLRDSWGYIICGSAETSELGRRFRLQRKLMRYPAPAYLTPSSSALMASCPCRAMAIDSQRTASANIFSLFCVCLIYWSLSC